MLNAYNMSKIYIIIEQKGHNMTNQTARVLELLKRFNDGRVVTISELLTDPLWEGKSEKTVRRDLEVIKEYFPQSFECVRGIGGAYRAITQSAFNDFIDHKMLSLMVLAYNLAQNSSLFENFNIDNELSKTIKTKINNANACYEFISKPFESGLGNSEILKSLEFAIKHKRKINLTYNGEKELRYNEIKPYKIVFMNENFYLICENDEIVSKFRVIKIKSVDVLSNTFYINPSISAFIKNMQTPFAKYDKDIKFVEIILQIDKSKAHFFKLKKFFRSQKIIEELENGDIKVWYKFTCIDEIISFVLSWLPNVKILEPLHLKEKIKDIINKTNI